MEHRETSDATIPRGLLYMAGSAFFFSIMSVLVKWAGQTLPSQEIVFFRSAGVMGLALGHLRMEGIDPWGNNRRLLLVRGLVGFVALSCFYYALTELPLPDATLIQYTNPIWTALLAAIFLGELLGLVEILGLIASLVGVVLIQQPTFLFGGQSRLPPEAVLVAICGAVAAAGAYVIVRRLRRTEHTLVVVFYFAFIATILSIPTAAPTARWPTGLEWGILLGIGVVTYLAQVMLTRGLHLEKAGRATAISYLQIVFAFIWGMLLFGEYPTPLSVVGAVLIIGSTGAIAWLRSRS